MPSQGSINVSRNPLKETEASYGVKLMKELAQKAGGLMAYGADIHGELNSRAYVDIMYPAWQFDSAEHRRLMAIAERTKSVIDATLFGGIQDEIENATGGNESEGVEEISCHLGPVGCVDEANNAIPTKPAHWATVWDTLGYTDTGFIGDYLATDIAVTGMDHEIFLNHTVPDKVWNVYLQENHINASRGIIKTAMAYSLHQDQEFSTFRVETGGQAGYVYDPAVVTDKAANGPGELPGPEGDGIGQDGLPVKQASYSATRMRYFDDASTLMTRPFVKVLPGDIAGNPEALDELDSLVLADVPLPRDARGRSVDRAAYFRNLEAWVGRGGNLVLTDKALHALVDLGLVEDGAFGLRDYGLTYSGLYVMENAVRYDAPGLGAAAPSGFSPVRPGTLAVLGAILVIGAAAARRRRT